MYLPIWLKIDTYKAVTSMVSTVDGLTVTGVIVSPLVLALAVGTDDCRLRGAYAPAKAL